MKTVSMHNCIIYCNTVSCLLYYIRSKKGDNMQIDNNSSVPIYEQIYKQLLDYIVTGLMQTDDKLPSVRELSSSIHINPNTVVKAYRLLEEQGFIYSMPGKGSFVSSKQNIQTKLFERQIKDLSNEIINKSKYIGLTFEQLCQIMENAWEGKQ